MRVLHIGQSIARSYGGPARSLQGLVAAEAKLGVATGVVSLTAGELPWVVGLGDFEANPDPAGMLSTFEPDLVHLHGLWSPGLHHAALICRRWKIPYVISARGMLEPWSLKQKWLKKRIARFLYQDRDLKLAAALHATAESEAEQFHRLGFKNPVIVSPNGVNVPEDKGERKGGGGQRRVLFVSRMHPKKGVLELVESWARIRQSNSRTIEQLACELVYTMNGDEEWAYEQKVKDRILSLGMSYQDKDGAVHGTTSARDCDFIFTGSLDDDAKWQAYARADFFVLPTYSENFGIVVAEALWAGVPVVTTKGTPWRDIEERRCGRWIEIGVEPLVAALKEMINCSSGELREMGARGRRLIDEKYTWDAAAQAMIAGYRDVLSGKKRKAVLI